MYCYQNGNTISLEVCIYNVKILAKNTKQYVKYSGTLTNHDNEFGYLQENVGFLIQ